MLKNTIVRNQAGANLRTYVDHGFVKHAKWDSVNIKKTMSQVGNVRITFAQST